MEIAQRNRQYFRYKNENHFGNFIRASERVFKKADLAGSLPTYHTRTSKSRKQPKSSQAILKRNSVKPVFPIVSADSGPLKKLGRRP